MENPSIRRVLTWGADRLQTRDYPSVQLDAQLLLMQVLNISRTQLFSHGERILTPEEFNAYAQLIERRLQGEPIAYIRGVKEFYSLIFDVGPQVLIPRFETELLVDETISRAPEGGTVCEIGVGSGAVITAILVNRPDLTGIGIDISLDAVRTTRANARRHGVAGRLRLFTGDCLQALAGPVDLIVTNPPYVAEDDTSGLEREVALHEPHVALFGGKDGLDIIRRITGQSARLLHPGGLLIMEVGYGQHEAVHDWAAGLTEFRQTSWIKDLAGIPRVVIMEK